jgi:hypothetical protein
MFASNKAVKRHEQSYKSYKQYVSYVTCICIFKVLKHDQGLCGISLNYKFSHLLYIMISTMIIL